MKITQSLGSVSGQPHIAKLEEGGGVECVLELTGITGHELAEEQSPGSLGPSLLCT